METAQRGLWWGCIFPYRFVEISQHRSFLAIGTPKRQHLNHFDKLFVRGLTLSGFQVNTCSSEHCDNCLQAHKRCLCASFHKVSSLTKVTFVVHAREWSKRSNTARVALQNLAQANPVFYGLPTSPRGKEWRKILDPKAFPVLLFPSASKTLEQRSLEALETKRPLQLIFPDGNWRQAGKMMRELAQHLEIPLARLEGLSPTRFYLRKDKKRHDSVCTIEATSYALLECGDRRAAAHLMRAFEIFVKNGLAAKGQQSKWSEPYDS